MGLDPHAHAWRLDRPRRGRGPRHQRPRQEPWSAMLVSHRPAPRTGARPDRVPRQAGRERRSQARLSAGRGAAPARDPLSPVAGWNAIGTLFKNDSKQEIRRAFRASLDLDIIERMSERYLLDISTNTYLDREWLVRGLAHEKNHDEARPRTQQRGHHRRQEAAQSVPALRHVQSPCPDVATADMFPGEEPASIIRCSPVPGILRTDEVQPDEFPSFQHLPRLHHQADGRGQSGPHARVRPTAVDRMLGLLTRRDNVTRRSIG